MLPSTILMAVLLAAPAPTNDPQLAAQVRELVVQLNSRTLVERDRAEQGLVELGPKILPYLPSNLSRLPLEQRQRLTSIRRKLESAEAEKAAAGATVRLQGQDLPLSEVFAAIEKQTGNKILDYREQFGQEAPDTRITLNLQDVPFWQAIDEVLSQAGLGIYNYAGEAGLAVVSEPSGADRTKGAVYRGPFRFEATQIEAKRVLRSPGGESLKVLLEIAWEPRLTPIVLRQPLEALSASNEQGEPIQVDSTEAELEANVQPGSTSTELELPFKLPPRSVSKISQLRGQLSTLLPGPTAKFRFDDLAKAENVTQRQGAVAVTLARVREVNEGNYQVAIRVEYDEASGALESHRGWIYNNKAYLLGPDGNEVQGGFETTGQTENEVGIAYLFEAPGKLEDYEFVYETPSAILKSDIEYEIKDLPLP